MLLDSGICTVYELLEGGSSGVNQAYRLREKSRHCYKELTVGYGRHYEARRRNESVDKSLRIWRDAAIAPTDVCAVGGKRYRIRQIQPREDEDGLAANPIILVIAAIVAVIAIVKHLWDTSEEFRTAVTTIWANIQEAFQAFDTWLTGVFSTDWTEQFGVFGGVLNGFFHTASDVWENVKRIFQGILDFVTGVFTGDWEKAWGGVVDVFFGLLNSLAAIAKAPLNAVIGLLNGAIDGVNKLISGFNGIGFDMPKWLGGGSWHPNIPKIPGIPYLAKGGTLLGGSAVVGEKGPELLSLIGGKARVQPLSPGERAAGIAGTSQVRHTFGPLRVEGVNDKGAFVAAADYAVEELLTDILRRQARI